MRLAISAITALLRLVMAPTDAPALSLGRVLGPIAGPVNSLLRRGVRKAVRPYAYRVHRSRVRAAWRRPVPPRAAAAAAAAQAQAQPRQALPLPMLQGQLTQPEPFWPSGSQDLFDYVLWSKEAGLQARGGGALVASMFAQPSRTAGERGDGVAAGDKAEQTAAAVPAGSEPVCGEQTANRAEAATKQLRDALALADDEAGALAELHAALLKVDEQITAACPRAVPASAPERMRAMQDRLWAMRVAATNLRAPLQKLRDALTNEQRAKLDAPQPSESDGERVMPASMGARLCQAQTQRAAQWPADQIARAVRPNKDQQASLRALSQTSSQMSLMMAGSCPQKVPGTAPARLDAALDWLDMTLFAAANVAVAVDGFYRTLNDAQKAKFDTLNQ